MTAFTLGRMSHLDLLALWCRLHPDGHHGPDGGLARASKEQIAAAILNDPA